jgi:D-beta-D-heptose 7-phosphate kinase/D-beta-D-heptose 1-phosphate adenosyltransferase
VILSDYGKGALTDRVLAETIGYARAKRKPVIVDPKRRDFAAYSGASIITPNRQELTLATGLKCDSDLEAAAAAAAAHAACGADVLLTRSERGMSFFPLDGTPLHLPAVRREVFDVSGAGDTVVAVLATALAAKLPIAEAIKASNYAAGIVVGRSGTATLTREELIAAFSTPLVEDKPDGRLVDLEEAKLLRRLWQNQGFTVGIANGCFDIIHPGHISLIRQATQACDRLIMALNTDASVRRLKGQTRPAQKEVARAEVIGAIKGVALVVLFNEDTPYNLISALQPDVLIKGADYTEDQVAGADIVRARGGKILLAELTEGHSTTRLLEAAQ